MSTAYLKLETFRKYAAIFENVKANETLKTALAEHGYDDTAMEKGKALYDIALEKLKIHQATADKQKQASANFTNALEAIRKTYASDRKKAKIIFDEQPETLSILGLKSGISERVQASIEQIEVFYTKLQASEELRTPLEVLKITSQHINQKAEEIQKVRKLYLTFLKEKGESQNATKQKNAAFLEVDKWVKKFYSIAKIALEEEPQLLEVIGKFVRS